MCLLVDWLVGWFARECVRSLVRWFARWFARWFVRSCVLSLVHSFSRLFLRSFVCVGVRSFVHSFVRMCVRVFVRAFFLLSARSLLGFLPFHSIPWHVLLSIRSPQKSVQNCSTILMISNSISLLFFSDKHFWTQGFVMAGRDKLDCVPLFLGELADDIFVCGKTINLLKLCCPEVCLF